MPSTITSHGKSTLGARMLEHSFTAVGATDWVKLTGEIAVQITGAATAITAKVQRSTRDPDDTPNTANVGEDITGNPSTGIDPVGFTEPGAAWWRVDVTALTGSPAEVSLSGGGA